MRRALLLMVSLLLAGACVKRVEADPQGARPTEAKAGGSPWPIVAPRPAQPPPGAEGAKAALAASPRHGEWVDIPMAEGKKLTAWVVYPEAKGKAGVVLVIHEIFGLSDWVRAVADQLARDGFIAVAPDFLSGMGTKGGGTEELGDQVGKTIRTLTPAMMTERMNAARS